MHTPVLLKEALEGLRIVKEGKYIDTTVGEGGHLIEIASQGGMVLGIDRDDKQIQNLESRIQNKKNTVLVRGNFADIERIARLREFYPVDGILFDLGLSYEQLVSAGKGLSFKKLDEPLDMRLDESCDESAADLLFRLSEESLYELFAKNAEEIHSRAVAHIIYIKRKLRPLVRVGDLLNLIDEAVGEKDLKVYARIFQALRIQVNSEFENLKRGLEGALNLLKPNGRLVVLSFHSLEDRIVKRFMKTHAVVEVKTNVAKKYERRSFEKSALLRVMEKIS